MLLPLLAVLINPVLLEKQWTAWWVEHPAASATEFGVYHFRRTINLPAKPDHFVVHVSADNRYRLYVNGVSVSTGPAQSDLLNWRFDTVDVAAQLHAGKNVFAAVVWNGGLNRPLAQISHRTGFLLQGDSDAEKAVNSDTAWKVMADPAYSPVIYKDNDPRLHHQYYVAGALERFDATRYPWGWQQPDFDDSAWVNATRIDPGAPAGVESHQRWQLNPRPVPFLTETPQRFERVVRSQGVTVPEEFLRGGAPLHVPASSKAVVLLEQGPPTTGYPVLRVSGGRGAQIHLVYTEALYDNQKHKGNRRDLEGKHVQGLEDLILPDGGRNRVYEPLWTRNWRWVQMEIETAAEPLVIEDFHSLLTVYPAERVALFESDSPVLKQIWDAGWLTLQLCAQETFISDLSWERLQYIADTKVQALSWLALTGDDRLVRLAIEQLDASRVPSGLTQARYPANLEQFISPFSLYWVSMVHDYWRYRGDDEFTRRFLPGISQVLGWFEEQEASHRGRAMPWGWSAVANRFLFALELEESAELFEHFGRSCEATRYRQLAADLRKRTAESSYHRESGLFKDLENGHALISDEVNSMAILAGAVPAAERQPLLERLLKQPDRPTPFAFFHYYLGRALKQVGMGDRYLQTLGGWEQELRDGMMTFGEQAVDPRSDCHPWSTSPLFELLSTVAGIEPGEPGFKTVRIEPSLGALRRVHARMPHPRGFIEVWLERKGTSGLKASVQLPAGLKGEFVWNGQIVAVEGRRELTF